MKNKNLKDFFRNNSDNTYKPQKIQNSMHRITTGSEFLNEILHGYPSNQLTLIYGKPSTGKTTLALLAIQGQTKYNKKVIYIDTENGFSLERLKQLNHKINDYLKNIIVLKPNSWEEQEKIILNLPKKASLIIIDTIGNFYRDEKNKTKANESLIKQLTKLKEINNTNIPIIIINQVYTDMEGKTIPVSRNIITNFSKNIIKLENNSKRILVYNKKEFDFKIEERGIIKY